MARLVVSRGPDGERIVNKASIEFYAAVRTGTTVLPQVHITLAAADGKGIADWTPQPRLNLQGAQVAVPLPWDTLAAGRYTLTAVISVGAAPPLTLIRTITKGS